MGGNEYASILISESVSYRGLFCEERFNGVETLLFPINTLPLPPSIPYWHEGLCRDPG